MLFKAFVFLCVVVSAMAATQLNLDQPLQGTAVVGSQVDYSFSYDHSTATGYQFLYVLPNVGSETPQVSILKDGQPATAEVEFECSAAASSTSGQIKCSYSFQGCVRTSAPELYTVTVQPPSGASAAVSFTIGAINANAALSATAPSKTKLTGCCGFSGASWHYVEAKKTQVVETVSLTVTNGSLTSATLNSGKPLDFLPPGIFVIPDTSACTDINLWNLLQSVSHSATALATFSANLSADSAPNRVTVDVGGRVAVPGVSYWVLVVSNEDSSAEYTLTTTFSEEGAASILSSPYSAIFF